MHIANYRITIGNRVFQVAIRQVSDARRVDAEFEVTVNGVIHRVASPRIAAQQVAQSAAASSARQAPSANAVIAQLPGQIVETLVKNGDRVKNGDTLLILNSMKMNIAVKAHQDGGVADLKLTSGDTVAKSQTLLNIIPADAQS